MDQVLLSAGVNNFRACVNLAGERNLGIEVMAFAFPSVLDGDWHETVKLYQQMLTRVPGPVTLHGPFMDMAPGSPDPLINEICRSRYQHAIQIAAQLEAKLIVFHANFIASIHTQSYRQGWHRRNVDFWGDLAEFAQKEGVYLAMENMFEFDPAILGDVLADVNHPYLRACFDVGHAVIFGDTDQYSLEDWFKVFEPYVIHMHLNNTDGKLDVHDPLGEGVIDYTKVLQRIRQLEVQPTIVLEMHEVEHMEMSLPFFELDRTPSR